MPTPQSLTNGPYKLGELFIIFIAWKTLLWSIAYFSPGIGYDTSSDLLAYTSNNIAGLEEVPTSIAKPILKFVRWDAIYYTAISRNGHVYEQEWAFGKGLSTTLQYTAQALRLGRDITDYALVGVFVSHISHWLSVALLFGIANTIVHHSTRSASSSLPFIAAILHVISPGGIFLSAPYAESLFAFLNMLGFYLYTRAFYASESGCSVSSLLLKLASGFAFGLAATVRGNGIFSGIPFLVDAIEYALTILSPRIDGFAKSRTLLQLQFTILAGCCVGIGMAFPQYLAFREYCVEGPGERPWCKAWLPAIYTFVQSHYWQVGFLKYWTLSNLPLFLLASPALYILILSGVQGVRPAVSPNPTKVQSLQLRLALPQLVLAALALTNYHVQIITRLCSAYPFWYIWMAAQVQSWDRSGVVIRVFTMYGLIQAGLFASFLPPA